THAIVVDARRPLSRPIARLRIVVGLGRGNRLELDLVLIAETREPSLRVPDIGNAARHAGREIAPGIADHDDDAAGHVLATMVAGAFDDRDGTGIAHRKALARDALEISLAGNCAVENGVAD